MIRRFFTHLLILHQPLLLGFIAFKLCTGARPGRGAWLASLLSALPMALFQVLTVTGHVFTLLRNRLVRFASPASAFASGQLAEIGHSPDTPAPQVPLLYLLCYAGTAITFQMTHGHGTLEADLAGHLSLFSSAMWILFDSYYCKLPSTKASIVLGGRVPPFKLHDHTGREISLNNLLTTSYVLIIFIRGSWCLLCQEQLHEIADKYRELSARGVNVVVISSQAESAQALLTRSVGAPMTFLHDKGNKLAAKWGLLHKGGGENDTDTACPAAFVANRDLEVIYMRASEDYRVRPDPAEFLAAIDEYEELHPVDKDSTDAKETSAAGPAGKHRKGAQR